MFPPDKDGWQTVFVGCFLFKKRATPHTAAGKEHYFLKL